MSWVLIPFSVVWLFNGVVVCGCLLFKGDVDSCYLSFLVCYLILTLKAAALASVFSLFFSFLFSAGLVLISLVFSSSFLCVYCFPLLSTVCQIRVRYSTQFPRSFRQHLSEKKLNICISRFPFTIHFGSRNL